MRKLLPYLLMMPLTLYLIGLLGSKFIDIIEQHSGLIKLVKLKCLTVLACLAMLVEVVIFLVGINMLVNGK